MAPCAHRCPNKSINITNYRNVILSSTRKKHQWKSNWPAWSHGVPHNTGIVPLHKEHMWNSDRPQLRLDLDLFFLQWVQTTLTYVRVYSYQIRVVYFLRLRTKYDYLPDGSVTWGEQCVGWHVRSSPPIRKTLSLSWFQHCNNAHTPEPERREINPTVEGDWDWTGVC